MLPQGREQVNGRHRPPGLVCCRTAEMLRIYEKKDADYASRLAALCDRNATVPPEIEAAARKTIAEVRAGGDAALRALTARFEKRTLEAIELPAAEWDALAARTAPEVLAALEHAVRRVRAFHEKERHPSFEIVEGGIRVGSRVTPLARGAVYERNVAAELPPTLARLAGPSGRASSVRL